MTNSSNAIFRFDTQREWLHVLRHRWSNISKVKDLLDNLKQDHTTMNNSLHTDSNERLAITNRSSTQDKNDANSTFRKAEEAITDLDKEYNVSGYVNDLKERFEGVDLKKLALSHPLELVGAALGFGALIAMALKPSKPSKNTIYNSLLENSDHLLGKLGSFKNEFGKSLTSTLNQVDSLASKSSDTISETGSRASENVGKFADESIAYLNKVSKNIPNALSNNKSVTGILVLLGTGILASSLFKSSAKPILGSSSRPDTRPYEERSKEELYQRAKKLGIEGRSGMSKDELIKPFELRRLAI